MSARFLLWLGVPRSGSNYLSDLLHGFDGIVSFREVFQGAGVHVYNAHTTFQDALIALTAIGRAYGIETGDIRHPELGKRVRDDPGPALDSLRASPLCDPDTVVSFKVFPGQLAIDRLERLMARDDVRPVLFLRDPLDSYISLAKAKAVGQWINVDTTAVRPELSAEDYARWLRKRADWFDHLAPSAHRIAGCLRYEDLIARGPDEAPAILDRALSRAGISTGAYRRPAAGPGLRRQDRADRSENKVANWPAFREACEKLGVTLGADRIPFDCRDLADRPR